MLPPYSGAKPFISNDFDSLAVKMSALQMMKNDPADRWFKVRTLGGALATSSRDWVFFDSRGYDALSEQQRLAVAAHELTHIRARDADHQRRHVAFPGYVIWGTSFVLTSAQIFAVLPTGLPMGARLIVIILGFVASFFIWIVCLIILLLLNGRWRKAAELRCDLVAASVTSGEDMIAALGAQEALLSPELRKSLRYRVNNRLFPYPSFRERVEAIRACGSASSTI